MIQLIPLIYLKENKAMRPVGTDPPWFREDAGELVQILAKQGADAFYLHDLNVPPTGKSPNIESVKKILEKTNGEIWVAGNFRSLSAMEPYVEAKVDKIVLGGPVYQNPHLLKEAAEKFASKMAVTIEVKNNRVVIPGLVTPSHKTAAEYACRFKEEGAAAICLSESDAKGVFEGKAFQLLKGFLAKVKIPVLFLGDIQKREDLERLLDCEALGMTGVVIGKPLYENKIDIHSSIAYLNDLAVGITQEKTLT